jgi:hypothetical protein
LNWNSRQKISQHFAGKVLGLPTNDKNRVTLRKRFSLVLALKKLQPGCCLGALQV